MTESATPAGFSAFVEETISLADRKFLVRRATETDVPQLVSLLRDDALGAGREGSGSNEAAGYQHAFGLLDSDPNQLLVAVDEVTDSSEVTDSADSAAEPRADGQSQPSRTASTALVGTLQLTLIPSLSRRGSTRLQIEAVRIGPAAQGLGLGTAVFDWAHDCGRRFGASLAQLTTDKSRADAQRFYARLGYEASHEGLKLDLS
ncbi:MAG: GNAT family N-acetyltransferase [Brevibacterium aurantiacum]|uniref:N-acetyltransferase domain-containing protein n=1 Tax=Brevibacterium aurantiacum TaxID=273384 RepID=A0A2A3ZIG3_BREAU|nr:GNAT family N-acetyltransferase [Brevibacterium aurantiacum]PCC51450.1 hypothetical protein CIK62_02775 [Brevibacterium aurantiacum]